MDNLASFKSRFFAFIVDQLVTTLFIVFIMFAFGGSIGILGTTNVDGSPGILGGILSLIMVVLTLLFHILYFGYFWSQTGQTPGMRLLNIYVVDTNTQKPTSFVKAALRGTVGYYISGLLSGLGFVWALFDDHNQTWHDKIFNTSVVSL